MSVIASKKSLDRVMGGCGELYPVYLFLFF